MQQMQNLSRETVMENQEMVMEKSWEYTLLSLWEIWVGRGIEQQGGRSMFSEICAQCV